MAFNSIFWGIILMINYYIGGINILPTFIGYILMYRGLGRLTHTSKHFSKARNISFPLIFFTMPNLFQASNGINSYFVVSTPGTWGIVLAIVTAILQIAFFYSLCMGIAELAIKNNEPAIAHKANVYWKLYTMLMLCGLLSFVPSLSSYVAPVIVIVGVVTIVGMLLLLLQSNKKLISVISEKG